MRIALVTLLCTVVLTASGGTGARADDKAEVEKELKQFQGTWTFESVEAGGKEVPVAEFKGVHVYRELKLRPLPAWTAALPGSSSAS